VKTWDAAVTWEWGLEDKPTTNSARALNVLIALKVLNDEDPLNALNLLKAQVRSFAPAKPLKQ